MNKLASPQPQISPEKPMQDVYEAPQVESKPKLKVPARRYAKRKIRTNNY